ncbi:helix-turn-helix domain-containing protein [Streptomyces sp. NPDC055103]
MSSRDREGGTVGPEELGLTADEAAVYHALVGAPSALGPAVADATRLPRERTDAALGSLPDRGLVVLGGEGNGRFAAVHPAVALGGELVAHRERLQHAELTVAQLVETYRATSVDRIRTRRSNPVDVHILRLLLAGRPKRVPRAGEGTRPATGMLVDGPVMPGPCAGCRWRDRWRVPRPASRAVRSA